VSVVVLNGNGEAGAAANGSYLLGKDGYRVITPPPNLTSNAPTQDYFHSVVDFDPRQFGARLAAVKMAKLFGSADLSTIPDAIAPYSNGAMIVVVVGRTFHGTLAPHPVEQVFKREPPYVAYDPSAALPLLRGARHRVAFRLEYPTMLERSSRPDYEFPIRVYRISGGDKAVRLTFKTGENEHWGIEETDATGLPLFADKNVRRVIRGRTYDLYYSGAHLHVAVLHENGATYWVVNTLLDSLSNETMLSIAKGLHPLAK
jgi:hypothetical protein